MKLPYGQSNFKNIATQGFYYVDRTRYIERLEEENNRFLFYLRPRKFGKSLFISMLGYYYGLEHRADFQALFGKYHIGQHPTPLANAYLVLTLDFSGIMTDTKEQVLPHFTSKVRNAIRSFYSTYRDRFTEDDYQMLDTVDTPSALLDTLFTTLKKRVPDQKLYILIDEYDHFANELIAFQREYFKEIVSRNGFVRKFYEVIKEESRNGLVERMFATGVSPVTLDSLTSGFNIGDKISLNLAFHNMMGFTEAESAGMLAFVGVSSEQMPDVLADLREWYNGYLFHPDAPDRLYNPNMLIYFSNHFQRYRQYPEKLLDENIASDYGKVRRMLGAGGEAYSLDILEDVLAKGHVRAEITTLYTFDRLWVRDDYVSLLFYLGVLTIKGRSGVSWTFTVPNQVIKELYYDYFVESLRQRADIKETLYDEVSDAIYALSMDDEIAPLLRVVEALLARLSGRDVQHFGERHLHVIFAALLSSAQAWLVRSQPEVERRFVDILCTRLPQIPVNFSFAFELKYLKKSDAARLEETARAAKSQLEDYLQTPDLRQIPDLRAYAIVFVGDEAKSVVPVR